MTKHESYIVAILRKFGDRTNSQIVQFADDVEEYAMYQKSIKSLIEKQIIRKYWNESEANYFYTLKQ